MAHANKYSITYDDWYGDTTIIYIKERDFSGSVTKLTAGPNPLRISLKAENEDIFNPIKQTSAEIEVVSDTDFELLDLFTSDSKKYQVDVQKGGSTWWFGYLISDQYQEPYKDPKYVVKLYATDGLGWLKSLPLLEAEVPLTGYKDITVILDVLLVTKLGYTLDLYETINTYEDNQSSGSTDSVLDQTYIDFTKFNQLNSDYSCYDLLSYILRSFNSYIVQNEGAWHIIQIPTNITTHVRRKWVVSSGSFAYDSGGSISKVLATTTHDTAKASLVRLVGNTLMMQPAWRGFTMNQFYGAKIQLLDGGNFPYEDFTLNGTWTNSNWTISGTVTITPQYLGAPVIGRLRETRDNTVTGADTSDKPETTVYGHRWSPTRYSNTLHSPTHQPATNHSKTGLGISDQAASPDFVYQDLVMVATSDDMIFRLKYWCTYASANCTVTIEIHNTTSNEYVDDTNGVITWKAGSGTVTYTMNAGSNIQEEQEIKIPAIDDDGTIRVKLYELINGGGTVVDFVYQEALLYYLPSGVTMYDSKVRNVVVDDAYSFTPPVLDMMLGDAPDHDNNELCYGNVLYWDDSGTKTCTKDWETSQELLDIASDETANQHSVPYQLVSGKIHSKLVDWCSIIQEKDNSDRLFMINRGVFDDKNGVWDVMLRQMLDTATNLITGWTNHTNPWDTFTTSGAQITSAVSNGVGLCQAYTNNQSYSAGDSFILRWEADAIDADGYITLGGVEYYISTTHGARVIKTANAVSAPVWFSMDDGDSGTFTNITFYLYNY